MSSSRMLVAFFVLAGCSLGGSTTLEENSDTRVPDTDVGAPLGPVPTLLGLRVTSHDGDLCVYPNEAPLTPGIEMEARLHEGDVLVAQVFLPDCLSKTCDVDREAACSIAQRGSTLVVEATFSYLPVEGESCTMDCGYLFATCESGPLAAGEYDLVFGTQHETLTVPGTTDSCLMSSVECFDDSDCSDGFCGQDVEGEPVCRLWAGEGEPCGGYMPEGMAPRCAEGLVCIVQEAYVDLPGTCRAPCDSTRDCGAEQTCVEQPQGSFCA